MNQDMWNFAAGAIAVLFLIFITARGVLKNYIELLIYTPPNGAANAPQMDASQAIGGQIGGTVAGALAGRLRGWLGGLFR